MSTLQQYISEKFAKFADKRNLLLLEAPTMCSVIIPKTNKGKTQHMAALTIKKGVEGFLINLADRNLQFFPKGQVICVPVRNGETVKGNSVLRKNGKDTTFLAR